MPVYTYLGDSARRQALATRRARAHASRRSIVIVFDTRLVHIAEALGTRENEALYLNGRPGGRDDDDEQRSSRSCS